MESNVKNVVMACGVLVVVGLSTSLAMVTVSKDKENEADQICSSPECHRTASQLIENMDPKINPCDNFYDFTCGGYIKSAPIPDGEISIDLVATLRAEIRQRLRETIEEPSSPDEPRLFGLAKDLYRACMNTINLERLGYGPLFGSLEQHGKWPVVEGDNWKGDEFSWKEMVLDSNYFLTMTISSDWMNSKKHIIMFDQPSFGLFRESLIKGMEDPGVQAYYEYMVDIAVLLGANKQRARTELEESLEFEIELAKITPLAKDRQNYTLLYNPMTIAELSTRYPSVNWEDGINKVLAPNVRVDASEVVIVSNPSFVTRLEKLIRDTPERVQANYLGWRIVLDFVKYLPEEVRKRESEFTAALTGVKRSSNLRSEECTDIVAKSLLSISTDALYIRKHLKEETRHNVAEIVTDIKNELVQILKKADWLDEKTRSKAVEKAGAIFSRVGYPVELLDDKKIEGLYRHLEISPNDLLGSIRNLTQLDIELTFDKLRKPVEKTEWAARDELAQPDAFYVATDNSIHLSTGMLQGIFFNNDRPRYINYGAVGFVIGHEMTHILDEKSRQFDKDGNLVNWWTPEADRKYLEKAQCIVDQYDNYIVPSVGLNLDGTHTLGENIADIGGIKVAYFAYKEYVKRNGPEPKLPGLDYTPEQLFWISAGHSFCAKYRPEAEGYALTADSHHSPERFRVIGSVSNMPEFAADFNCPLGSNMNPARKCSVI